MAGSCRRWRPMLRPRPLARPAAFPRRTTPMKAGSKGLWGWTFFDWAKQPFHKVIMLFVFGPCFCARQGDGGAGGGGACTGEAGEASPTGEDRGFEARPGTVAAGLAALTDGAGAGGLHRVHGFPPAFNFRTRSGAYNRQARRACRTDCRSCATGPRCRARLAGRPSISYARSGIERTSEAAPHPPPRDGAYSTRFQVWA